jgi:hypothetical protein
MEITLHATVKGRLWSGQRARLQIDKPLRRHTPLAHELAQILCGCGDFDGGAKAFTEDSFVQMTITKVTKSGLRSYIKQKALSGLPSIAHLME